MLNQVKLNNGKCINIKYYDIIIDELEKIFDWETASKIYDLISIEDTDIVNYVYENSQNFEESLEDILDTINDIEIDAKKNINRKSLLNSIECIIENVEELNTNDTNDTNNKECIINMFYEIKQQIEKSNNVNLQDIKYLKNIINNSVIINT